MPFPYEDEAPNLIPTLNHDDNNKKEEIGDLGELWAVKYEGSISRSRPADLARKVEHIAKTREMVLVTTFYHTTLMGR